MTLDEFITRHGIELKKIGRVVENPNMDSGKPMYPMYHYLMTISMGDREFCAYLSTGTGWIREPGISDLLECLILDASWFDRSQSFEDWADEYGYDPDSRKAERLYKTVEVESLRLKEFFGGDLFEEALSLEF